MRKALFYIISILVLPLLMWPNTTYGAAAVLSFSPNTATVQTNQTLTTTVNLDTNGEAVGAVEVKLSWDNNLIQYQSIDYSGSPFGMQIEETIGAGSMTLARVTLNAGGYTGSTKIATIVFKALKESSGNISISQDSKIYRLGTGINLLSSVPSLNYVVSSPTQPDPTPPVEPAPSPVNPTPTPPPAPKKPEPVATVSNTRTVNQAANPALQGASQPSTLPEVKSIIDPQASKMVINKEFGVAKGMNSIQIKIYLKDSKNNAITNVKPIISVVDKADYISDPILENDYWVVYVGSKTPGQKTIIASANGIEIRSNPINFPAGKNVTTKKDGTNKNNYIPLILASVLVITFFILLTIKIIGKRRARLSDQGDMPENGLDTTFS